MIQRVGVLSSLEEHRLHRGQIVLETVIDAGEKTRAEGHLKHPAFELHRVSVFQSTGAFEHLDRGLVTAYLDDLGQEGSTRKGDVAELVLRHRSVHLNRHKVGNNSCYLSFCLHIQLFQFSLFGGLVFHAFECASDLVYEADEHLAAGLLVEGEPSSDDVQPRDEAEDGLKVEVVECGDLKDLVPHQGVQTTLAG